MIICKCGKKINKVFVAAYIAGSTVTRANRPVIVGDGLKFLCEECCSKEMAWWAKHNKGRVEPYQVETTDVSIDALTKVEFAKKVLPQIINSFKDKYPGSWYIGKSAIKRALTTTQKGKL